MSESTLLELCGHCSTGTTQGWTSTRNEAARLIPRVFEAYGAPLYEYDRDTFGLLIAVGSGLLMATMDADPTLRWALDIGGQAMPARLADVLLWAERMVSHVVVNAWWSVSDPAPLREALRVVTRVPVIVRSNVSLIEEGHPASERTCPSCLGRVHVLAERIEAKDMRQLVEMSYAAAP